MNMTCVTDMCWANFSHRSDQMEQNVTSESRRQLTPHENTPSTFFIISG